MHSLYIWSNRFPLYLRIQLLKRLKECSLDGSPGENREGRKYSFTKKGFQSVACSLGGLKSHSSTKSSETWASSCPAPLSMLFLISKLPHGPKWLLELQPSHPLFRKKEEGKSKNNVPTSKSLPFKYCSWRSHTIIPFVSETYYI